jgi:RsiW-degrading membrane proteinase PrsW (M82 family)
MWPYAAALHGNDWMMWLVLWIYLPALVLLLWPTPLRAAATEPTTHQSSTAA